MNHPKRRHNLRTLWILILLAITLGGLYYSLPTLTGVSEIDGLLGVCLGLYTCSHPAANFLDILLFRGHTSPWDAIRGSAASWLALNLFVMLVGFLLIVAGTLRYFREWK
jgi:amino acid permease